MRKEEKERGTDVRGKRERQEEMERTERGRGNTERGEKLAWGTRTKERDTGKGKDREDRQELGPEGQEERERTKR